MSFSVCLRPALSIKETLEQPDQSFWQVRGG